MPTPEMTASARSQVVTTVEGPGGLPTYVLSDEILSHGSSLGNGSCWVTTKSTGVVESVFSLRLGTNVLGSCLLRYCGRGLRLIGQGGTISASSYAAGSGEHSYVEMEPYGPGLIEAHPAFQRHSFTLPGDLDVEETVFLPDFGSGDVDATVCVGVVLRNRSGEARQIRMYGFAELSEGSRSNQSTAFDPSSGAVVARDIDHPDWVRLIGFDREPSAYESSRQRSLAYEPYAKRPLNNHLQERGDVMAVVQLDLELPVGGEEKLCWLLCFSDRGLERARESMLHWKDWERALAEVVSAYTEALSVCNVMVPEKVITNGVLWSKANMLRVMGCYPTGAGFTNDPGRSSNVVVRDVSWFVYGCDYLKPEYSAELLRLASKLQQPSGKIVEFWDALTGKTEDYGLNINDDTPLFILAAGHHYLVSLDHQFLEDIYPAVSRATRYLLSQKDSRGLVFCTAEGTNVEGICGWRNVIPDVGISGAVTEVNSECYAALRMSAEMARALKRNGDVGEFLDEAVGLRDAINQHLLNPENGAYYLNIDPEGNAIADVTCDEIFPVMFGVAEPEVAFRIISRLSRPDFWTSAGLRTASSNSPEYTPDRELGLRGGVWPGVSFWYAFAAARYHPESMERALGSFQHYNEDPIRFNTVPGQFSEWFDGESLANRGMRLSPWEPPRLLWAAVEGMLGVVHSIDGYLVQPLVPAHWKWLAVRRLPHAHGEETMFLARVKGRLHIYGNAHGLSSDLPVTSYDQDISDSVRCFHPDASMVALLRKDDMLVCVGNSADRTITVPLKLEGVLSQGLSYYLETFDSELQDWTKGALRSAEELRLVASPVEAKGFRLFRLTPVKL